MTNDEQKPGLAIAQEYWAKWGQTWLAAQYPDLLESIGVGLFSGSEVLGADDELSRDHGWGPRFDLFRTDERVISNDALEKALREAAPKTWEGFQVRYQFTPAINVHCAVEYFGHPFPANRLPDVPADWVCCEYKLENLESHLHYVRHGAVFHDPGNILALIQKQLHAYPDDIWLLRMTQLCFEVAHYGEYNFCWRLAKRKDPVAAEMAVGRFAQAVMALCLVMERDYAPYWKWLHHVFASYEIAKRIDPELLALSSTLEYGERVARIQATCKILMDAMVKREIVPADLDDGSGLPIFFQARAYFLGQIKDPAIRRMMM